MKPRKDGLARTAGLGHGVAAKDRQLSLGPKTILVRGADLVGRRRRPPAGAANRDAVVSVVVDRSESRETVTSGDR